MFRAGRRRFLLAAAGLGSTLGLGAWRQFGSRWIHEETGRSSSRRTSQALGTKVSIVVLHDNAQQANAALDDAFAAIEQVEAVMSIYRPDSELSRLNRDGRLDQPHPDLVRVLLHAQTLAATSAGAFDVTVQPLWEVFAQAQRQGRLPQAEELAAANACVGWRRLEVRPERLRLHGAGTKVTLNGIAQGFAADQALAALYEHGVEHALIDTGELAGLGEKAFDTPWQVGVQHPREPEAYIALAKLQNRCLSTSGDYATTFSVDHKYNHVFDPRTGQSPVELASVSIAAPTALQADALSTACFVLGAERGAKLLRTLPDVDALFVHKDGRTQITPGFPLVQEGAPS